MLKANDIYAAQDHATQQWHHEEPSALPIENNPDSIASLVLAQHLANFKLWHAEDQTRAPHASGDTIAHYKRLIDALNQQRNDLAEQIDLALLRSVEQTEAAPLHSETPGMMIDRLSILSLKRFHTAEQIERTDADAVHIQRNVERLALLEEQSADLAAALNALWAEIANGTRRFKLYRQLKMYNDPALNPAIYSGPKS